VPWVWLKRGWPRLLETTVHATAMMNPTMMVAYIVVPAAATMVAVPRNVGLSDRLRTHSSLADPDNQQNCAQKRYQPNRDAKEPFAAKSQWAIGQHQRRQQIENYEAPAEII
jgi:hypothetical protein